VDPRESRLARVARLGMEDEYLDFTLYDRLSKRVRGNSSFSDALEQLSGTEKRHFEFWRKYVPEGEPKYSRAKLLLVLFLYRVFGITFAVRYLERHESQTIKEYKSVESLVPAEDRAEFDAVIRDEEKHEKEFSGRVETASVRYIAFVILGLADALVEVSGIHAGSLGIYDVTEIAGLAGIVAGGAASIAMASAAFAQAKQGFQGSASRSAVYTGVFYFVAAVSLATPYFLTQNMIDALTSSLAVAIIMLAVVTYYSCVISGKPFARDFAEILAILLGATVALFLFGTFIRVETGITV
jgi:VIT1/CCC1 family predicted Fe2+/Mn2+ transporter